MKITIFGLALTSSWGNGHATTYRALCSALARRGHKIVFFEHDAEWYANNRDVPQPPYLKVVNYETWGAVRTRVRAELNDSDVAIVGSYFPHAVEAMEEMFVSQVGVKAFYDIDTPITLSQLRTSGRTAYLRAADIPRFDIYFSFTGGPALKELEVNYGAKRAAPLYCSVDPDKYFPSAADKSLACEMSYMGTYAPDRQPKLEELLCLPARRSPKARFIVAGSQYPPSIAWPKNVRRIEHLESKYHSQLYSSSKLVLNVTRRDMVMAGYSPSVRLFEAAACGAAVVSDPWPGLDKFFVPGKEILLASSQEDILRYMNYDDAELRRIGNNARERALTEHSNLRRAEEFEMQVQAAMGSSAQVAGGV